MNTCIRHRAVKWQKKTGFIVPPGDHQQIARSICSILDQPGTQQRMKLNIEKMKKIANNWQITADKAMRIYSELLEEQVGGKNNQRDNR